jgi:lysophospholipase L1-like esterase
VTEPTQSHSASITRATILKTMFGLLVFCAVFGGWYGAQTYARMHEPLPDAGGRQGQCVVWFLGSSSINRWTSLAEDMAPWIVHNRGVGGAFVPELRQRFANEDVPVPPEAIVFYAGENDIANGESAAHAAAQFRRFLDVKMAKLPSVPLLVLSTKPSPGRWPMRTEQLAYDGALRNMAAHHPDLTFVDAAQAFLVNGRPGPFYADDGVHLNGAGYRAWVPIVRHALATHLPREAVDRCLRPQPPSPADR